MTTIHEAPCTTFTFTCVWGCTVQVAEGVQEEHPCTGVSHLVDALRTAPGPQTVLELAKHLEAAIAPEVRVLKADAWETGVHDGRSGEKFAGIDPLDEGGES